MIPEDARSTFAGWLVLIAFVAGAIGFRAGEMREARASRCEEDQARVVKVDTNPHHGLNWHCVSLDSLTGGYAQ